jgi:trimethylamine--corrinoid protein Co-methyltransferase
MTPTLTETAREALHEAVLDLLATEGMRVAVAAAREELAAAGATVEGETVRLPPETVTDALETAPSAFRLRARDPDQSVTVGEGDPVIAPIRGPRYVKRPGEARHRATMADFDRLVKLTHQESTIDLVGYDVCSPEGYSLPGNPGGFDQVEPGYELLEALFTGSHKPIVATARSGPEATASLEMARAAFQQPDLDDHVVIAQLTVRSPRWFNEPMVEGLLRFARAGQPLVIASGAIPGASAPVSLSEAAVQATAEALFGVVLVQTVAPGTPVVIGRTGTGYDWGAESVTAGSPRGTALQDAVVDMANHYDLPARGGGAATDAKQIDDRSGAESTYHLGQALGSEADLLMNATGGLDAYATVSPEKTVLDAERIRGLTQARRDEASLVEALEAGPSLSAIRDSAPGSPFFDDRDPAAIPDATSFGEPIGFRGDHDSWIEAGAPTTVASATDRVESLLADYERPPIDEAAARDLEEIAAKHS